MDFAAMWKNICKYVKTHPVVIGQKVRQYKYTVL